MPKTRVYELAKKLNVGNKDLIEKLKKIDIEVKNHMSALTDEQVNKTLKVYSNNDNNQSNKNFEKKQDFNENRRKSIEKSKTGNKEVPKKEGQNNEVDTSLNKVKRNKQKNKNMENKTNKENKQYNNNDKENRQNKDYKENRENKQNKDFKENRENKQNKDFKENRENRQNKDFKENRENKQNKDFREFKEIKESRQNREYKQNKESRKQNKEKDRDRDRSRDRDKEKDREIKENRQNKHNENNKNKKNIKKDSKQNKSVDTKPETIKETINNDTDEIKIIQIGPTITVKELSDKLGKSASEVIMSLMKMGVMASANQEIEFKIASIVAENFDTIAEEAQEIDILEETFKEEDDSEEDTEKRPPVVVVMGHVDHGKTSLLDAIRHSKVTANEAGGITQHIGAYTVSIDNKPITFLDTPGHEAFTAMRMRGAQVTDVAILVVAADDGVMPQTIEAINHAKAANVEIIVAINKIDKPSANPDRVKQELVEYGLVAEDWGGDTICVPVSAVTKSGIDQLLEMIILVSELKELKANPDKRARGTIIEAQLDKGRGPVATVLVQNGTLKVGDPIVAGSCYGRIRAMMNDKGQKVKKAGPSMPVEILGLSEVPQAGDMFYVAKNEKQARQVAESIIAKDREDMIKATPQKVSLDDLFNQIQSGNVKELNIVIKADVQGSVEAVKMSLEKLSNEEVHIRTIHGGVGAITESDVMLASASNAIIIGFNVRPEASAKSFADDQKVDIRLYRVIYNAIEDITAAMKGLLDPVYEEKIIGHAEIRKLFKASGVGTIGGSYVTDGKFIRNTQVRILRDNRVIYEGELAALRRFKDDVKEVNSGYECGLSFNKFNDIKEGDVVEAFVMEEIPQ